MVITLDKHKKPLGVCTERRARILLSKRRACVHRYYPFTIIVKDTDSKEVEQKDEYQIKIDPGAKHTGIAVVRTTDDAVVFYQRIEHRGEFVKKNLDTRRAVRRNRRNREVRYRKPRWGSKQLKKGKKSGYDTSRPEGWLPPSVKSVADNIISWVIRLCKLFNITKCSFEAVRFDTQLLDNPDIEGVEYQHGSLFGFEIKEYLLHKYGHVYQYCRGVSGDPILEWEHMLPKSRGGSDKLKNATLSCHTCNQDKSNQTPEEWLATIKGKHKLDEARRECILKVIAGKTTEVSNRYCAWTSSYRRYAEKQLFDIFGDVECSSGGRTKYNREKLGFPKDHHYDALCVGTVPEKGYKDLTNGYVFVTKAMGRGSRFRGKVNTCGIITVKLKRDPKRRFGFQNGDIVRADVPKGKYAGKHVGRVMTRANGYFDIRKGNNVLVTVNRNYCIVLQHDNGFLCSYSSEEQQAFPVGYK